MAAFFRKDNKTTIAELEEYYANQKSSKNSLKAWLMALLSLIITVAVILGIFFAGRLLYRTLTNNDSETAISGIDDAADLPSYDGDIAGSVNTNTGSIDDLDGDTDSSQEGTVTDQAATTDSSSNDSATAEITRPQSNTSEGAVAGSSTTPTNSNSELPNTGASEIALIAAPFLTLVLGYAVSRKFQLNK